MVFLSGVDSRVEIREFLTSRRARLTPEQTGMVVSGRNRRVPGLRREEVAMLAQVSVDYYTRLERGHLHGASEAVLNSLARALLLDEAERAHLFDLARAANAAPGWERRPAALRVPPGVQRILDAMVGAPALLRNARHDVLSANRLGYALYSEMFADAAQPANNARFVFLNPRSTQFFVDWERVANAVVATLRIEAGRHPYDKALSDVVGELSTRSESFRTRWATHNVRLFQRGDSVLLHPVVGELHLSYQYMELRGEDLEILVYTAETGSPSRDALDLLASWTASVDETQKT